jgi:hypothetical protein
MEAMPSARPRISPNVSPPAGAAGAVGAVGVVGVVGAVGAVGAGLAQDASIRDSTNKQLINSQAILFFIFSTSKTIFPSLQFEAGLGVQIQV